jgi:hypothetical protein
MPVQFTEWNTRSGNSTANMNGQRFNNIEDVFAG